MRGALLSTRQRRGRRPSAVALVLAGALLLGACSSAGVSEPESAESTESADDAASATSPESADDAVTVLDAVAAASLLADRDDVVVIDVRTPEEFDSGHVEGALLADVQRPDFDAQVEPLDRDATYVLYCRSGNRSAVAAERMRAAGFTDLYDAGAFTGLAGAGVPTV